MEHDTENRDDVEACHHLMVNFQGRDARFLIDVLDQLISRTNLILVRLIVAVKFYALEDAFFPLPVAVISTLAEIRFILQIPELYRRE